MKKNRKYRAIIICAICLAVAGLNIGYSALSQQLTVNTAATLKSSSWLIKLGDISNPTIVGSATADKTPVVTSTNISLAVSVTKPGDSVSYTFDVVNEGTVDAILSSEPIITGLSEAQAKYVNYSLTYLDGSKINTNDELNQGQTRKLKLVVSYDNSATVVSDSDIELNINSTLLYVQK